MASIIIIIFSVLFQIISAAKVLTNNSITIPLFPTPNYNHTQTIARDISRVNFLSQNKLMKPDLLDTPVVSGQYFGTSQYLTQIGIGSNTFLLAIDTGSDLSWIQCQPCTDCYSQDDSVFNPTTSSTYAQLPCLPIYQCSGCSITGTCDYKISYGDGSYTIGDLGVEMFTFGDNNRIRPYPFGCGHSNHGTFAGFAGILGLGRGFYSITSLLRADTMSCCLVNHESLAQSTIDFNVDHTLVGEWIYTPLFQNPHMQTFYYVGLVGFQVDGEIVDIPPGVFDLDMQGNGGVILDSGTVISWLPTDAYVALKDAFLAKSPNLGPVEGCYMLDTCFEYSESITVLPTVSLLFNQGAVLSLEPSQILFRCEEIDKYCFAFAKTTARISIIGNTQQQGTRISFNLQAGNIGFSPNSC